MRIVVVGAGVLGASTAYHLSLSGARVVVIDANLDGRATAAGAGIICPWVSAVEDEAFYGLYAASGAYYADLISQLEAEGETELGYRQTGAMLVSADPDELEWLEQLAVRRQVGAPAMGRVTRLAPAQARALFPPLQPRLGGVHVSGGARVDGRKLAAALLRAAQARGATVMRGYGELEVETGRVTGVRLREGRPVGDPSDRALTAAELASADRIPADRVIFTAGAWADQGLRPLGLRLDIEPQRGQIVHLRLGGVTTDSWPVILPTGSHYIVPFDDGRIVAGATRETGSGFDYRVTAAGQAEVLAEALKVAPGLGAATMIETRVGFRPVNAAEGRPLLGWVPSVEGLAVGNGLGAAGLTIGPFGGRLLADLVLDLPSRLDLAPFGPMRRGGFGANAPADLR